MKKLKIFIPLFIFMIGLMLVSSAQSNTYSFSPIPSDLNDLDHYYNYEWGINWSLPSGEAITEAKLTYYNIWDWRVENDNLYTHLLDTVTDPNNGSSPNWSTVFKTGYNYQTITISGIDNQNGGDYFLSQGYSLGVWSDPEGGHQNGFNLVYTIPFDHYAWLSDGNFGFGIDPDCHYYNDKIKFKITTTTTPVPEPATMFLLGSGLIGLAGFARRRFKK